MGKLLIVSGPSCIGKGLLCAALRKLYPDLVAGYRPVVLFNDREPRPGEVDGVDYHFRARREIEEMLEDPDYMVMDVRGDMQAIDLRALEATLCERDSVYEGNPFVGVRLISSPLARRCEVLSIFLSPLSRDEIAFLRGQGASVNIERMVAEIMRRKLLRRTQRQNGILSLKNLENIEVRARSAYGEMKEAHRFDWVVPNHDGEDSENWDAFYYPVGDARRTTLAVSALMTGQETPWAEKWDGKVLP